MLRVAVTGGIGSGKSTACALFAGHGVGVYDSDSAARRLMNESSTLRSGITALFGGRAYEGGRLNRPYLASVVFSDAAARERLNALVHPAVMADFDEWCRRREDNPYVIFESAILYEAGLAAGFDCVVAVVAPLNLRIERTCRRDSTDPAAVERRMAAQMSDDELAARADYTVVNIERGSLADDVAALDRLFRKKSEADAVVD